MSLRLTQAEYEALVARAHGDLLPAPVEKPHKYHARKVVIDGITFASKWEGQCYVDLKWQAQAGLITFPLLQVPFALGQHYGKERYYVADFVYCTLTTGVLIVADAKGYDTPLYKQKKRIFEALYHLRITEIRRA